MVRMKKNVFNQKITRESFLKKIIAGIGGLLLAIPIIPGILHAVEPAVKKQEKPWISLGFIDDYQEDEPELTTFSLSLADGKSIPRAIYVIKGQDNQFVVFDSHCTHLGCPVRWNEKSQYFLCPCHGAVFEKNGDVLAGPPSKPLARYEWKIQSNELFIKEELMWDEFGIG